MMLVMVLLLAVPSSGSRVGSEVSRKPWIPGSQQTSTGGTIQCNSGERIAVVSHQQRDGDSVRVLYGGGCLTKLRDSCNGKDRCNTGVGECGGAGQVRFVCVNGHNEIIRSGSTTEVIQEQTGQIIITGYSSRPEPYCHIDFNSSSFSYLHIIFLLLPGPYIKFNGDGDWTTINSPVVITKPVDVRGPDLKMTINCPKKSEVWLLFKVSNKKEDDFTDFLTPNLGHMTTPGPVITSTQHMVKETSAVEASRPTPTLTTKEGGTAGAGNQEVHCEDKKVVAIILMVVGGLLTVVGSCLVLVICPKYMKVAQLNKVNISENSPPKETGNTPVIINQNNGAPQFLESDDETSESWRSSLYARPEKVKATTLHSEVPQVNTKNSQGNNQESETEIPIYSSINKERTALDPDKITASHKPTAVTLPHQAGREVTRHDSEDELIGKDLYACPNKVRKAADSEDYVVTKMAPVEIYENFGLE